MAMITTQFDPNDVAWYLTADAGVKEVTIISAKIEILLTSTKITYSVRINKSSSYAEVGEADLYATLSGVGSALEAYAQILTT